MYTRGLQRLRCIVNYEKKTIYNWVNELFSDENKAPRIMFGAIKVTGSIKYKLSKLSKNCVVLWKCKTEDLLILNFFPKLHSATFKKSIRLKSLIAVDTMNTFGTWWKGIQTHQTGLFWGSSDIKRLWTTVLGSLVVHHKSTLLFTNGCQHEDQPLIPSLCW